MICMTIENNKQNVYERTMTMPNDRDWRWVPAFTGLTVGHSHAAPIEGEIASNAAALLVVLGVWAIAMGARNLRELRYKRLVPRQHERDDPFPDIEPGDQQHMP